MSPSPHRVSFDPARYRPRSWAEKHQFTISIAFVVAGVVAYRAVRYFGLSGWPAFILWSFAAIGLYPWRGIWRTPTPAYRSDEVIGANRWKHRLIVIVFVIIIFPIGAWLALRAMGK
jgi:hypothetical protein